ncbi:hypothetical protein [Aquimarina algiphila]|uniref:XRE family transcriptional regulator n=1 Tax=Aquimarina algiphila TaxID=2047982 RepID=A0A554VB18_9FLAO|nr:hypothetical protein [Aquimarina algiphila]TSE03524.1 hypothetical protein FOF46_28985 [Aquimarina algiphila]
MNYKYCIKERLEALPVHHYRTLKNEIIKALGKTRRTFDRYCTISADEFADIPALDLDIIASFLDCEANDLKNYKVNKAEIRHKMTRRR